MHEYNNGQNNNGLTYRSEEFRELCNSLKENSRQEQHYQQFSESGGNLTRYLIDLSKEDYESLILFEIFIC